MVLGKGIVFLLLLASVVRSQSPPSSPPPAPSPITTDRPAFTDASTGVGAGTLLFEDGFLETATPGRLSFDFPETLMRFGLSDKTEIRFTVPDYYQNVNAGLAHGSGWGDTIIGLKQQFGPIHGFDVSLVASLSLPLKQRL